MKGPAPCFLGALAGATRKLAEARFFLDQADIPALLTMRRRS